MNPQQLPPPTIRHPLDIADDLLRRRRRVPGIDQLLEEAAQALQVLSDQTMESFFVEQAKWSQATFGTDKERGPAGPLKHLAKEVQEALACPGDLMEYTDLLFLVFDATRRAGFAYDQLLESAWKKLAINKARTWPKPSACDEPVEHDRAVTV